MQVQKDLVVESEAEKAVWVQHYGMEKRQVAAQIMELERKVREAKRAAGGEAMEGVAMEGVVAMEGAVSAEEAALLREEVEALKKAVETVGFGFSISICHSLTTLPPTPSPRRRSRFSSR